MTACSSINPLGHGFVKAAPDPRPARRLREQLELARELGISFDDAWYPCVDMAVQGLGPLEERGWREAFGMTSVQWAYAYDREDDWHPVTRIRALHDALDHDSGERSTYVHVA